MCMVHVIEKQVQIHVMQARPIIYIYTQSGAPVPASHSGESGVGGPPWTSGGCPPAVGDDGVGSPPWASGGCPPGFCGHNLGGLPQIPLAYSDFKNFSIFLGGMASHSGESGVGSPPWASGGCPPGFCGNDLGGLPQTPLANSDFSSLFNFPEVYASHSGEPGVGGSPGPPGGCPPGLGAAPGGLVRPCTPASAHSNTTRTDAPMQLDTCTHASMHPCTLTPMHTHTCHACMHPCIGTPMHALVHDDSMTFASAHSHTHPTTHTCICAVMRPH